MDKEQTSRALLNASADSAVLIDRNGVVLDANDNMAASLGTTRDKLVGSVIYHFMDPAIAKTRKEKELIAAREKRLVRFMDYRNKKWLENSVYPVFDSEGNLSQVAIFSRDMSSYIEVEHALKQERDRAKTYLDLAEVIIMALDSEDRISLMNRKGCHILGYPQDQLIGKNFFDFFTPADSRSEIKQLFRDILEEKAAPRSYFVNPIITKNKEHRTIAWNITVVRDDEGFVTGTLSSGTDITEQKKAEKALLESERYYKTLFESASDAILIVEGPLCIDCNQQTLKMFACTKEQIVGKTPDDFSPPFQPDGQKSGEKMFKIIKDIEMGATQSLEWRHRRHNGTVFDAEVHLAALDPERPERHVAIIRDITRRKQAEDALNEALEEVRRIKEAIEAENIYLHKEIQNAHLHGDIVGQSDAIKSVLSEAEQVARTDSTVLILGETGTGKELLARAIHNMSVRKTRPLVVVNCAAIPETLVESELFGREKGAFTGAITRQIGRFEIAHESTIFLDEIGELSLDIQAKLLRVLQEGELERLGSSRKIHVDVRIIAATNRDLRKSLNNNTFRKDLFYRLNVFPISMPPLRNRKEDIPFLVWHFVDQMGEKMGKRIEKIPQQSINNLTSHYWPGNIRELHNIIERAMIQTDDTILRVPPISSMSQHPAVVKKLSDVEKQHIIRVLAETGWRIRGTNGAAELLDIKPTTLESRLKKLRIERPKHKSEIS
ncbi:MAG: sigma 54-interacting transcriptional regulator [Acidobacteriota bacterium]